MDTIKEGAIQIVKNCLKVTKDDVICIITDKDAYNIAESINDVASQVTDNIKIFIIEDFGERLDDGSNPIQFPDVIKKSLEKSDVSLYIAGSKKGELKTFRQPMFRILDENHIRHAHMIGITDEIMQTGMCVDYTKVKEVTSKVYNALKSAKVIHVKTQAGTDIIATFDINMVWVGFDGNITKEQWTNLPEGEVFTCPKDVNGKIIVDGVLGDYFDTKYGVLKDNPVTIEIKNSRVISVSCANKDLENEFKAYIKQDENSNRVGEFAIGTNIGINNIIGNMLQDEKHPGVHIAFGDSHSELTKSDWKSSTHIDCVLLNCTVVVDGKKIMENSKFLI
ncbi:MAG: aminopeptidase [DPANN group archaeon]|nr:aminopeptidase [DPANN group archaeon]